MAILELSRPLPVEKIDRKGQSQIIEATTDECEALANRFSLISVSGLKADIRVEPQSGGTIYYVTGQLTAHVEQESVISGYPVSTDISQDIEAWYADHSKVASFTQAKKQRDMAEEEDEHEIRDEKDDPEKIYNGILDLGEVAAQFLGLALDDFPRHEEEPEGAGDHIEVTEEDAKPNPFAALAQLKEKK